MAKVYDFQRANVYRAERGIADQRMTPSEVVAFIQSVERTPYWVTRCSKPIRIKLRNNPRDRRGWARSRADYNLISLPAHAWHKRYILHELTHFISSDRHGPEFVLKLHDMFLEFLGPGAASQYRFQCFRAGVIGCPHTSGIQVPYQQAAGPTPQTARLDPPAASLSAYEDCYRRFRLGQRSSPPGRRKGLSAGDMMEARQRVDQELAR